MKGTLANGLQALVDLRDPHILLALAHEYARKQNQIASAHV